MKVLKFYSTCCGQCKVLAREFKEHPLLTELLDINAEENLDLVEKYNISSVPTTILINGNDEVVETWRGIVKSEVINNRIKNEDSKN